MKIVRQAAVVVGTVATIAAMVAPYVGMPELVPVFMGIAAGAGAVATVSTMLMKRPSDFGGGSQTDFKSDRDAGIPCIVGRTHPLARILYP